MHSKGLSPGPYIGPFGTFKDIFFFQIHGRYSKFSDSQELVVLRIIGSNPPMALEKYPAGDFFKVVFR